MQVPLQITVRDMPHSPALEQQIQKKARKLDQFYNRITACRVTIKVPQKHKHQGKLFNITIDLTVPGQEIVVKRNNHEDIYIALREAFADATRKLEEHVRKQRENGTYHPRKLLIDGMIIRLFPQEGYGFIEANDGHEVYFNECVVNSKFSKLKLGTGVKFTEEMGMKGPQAAKVRLIPDESRLAS